MSEIHNPNNQCLLGLQCKDFAIIAADQVNSQDEIIVMKHDENKFHHITDKLLMAIIGDQGDAVQFAQFVTNNIKLYKTRNKYGLDTAAAAYFIRKNFADPLLCGTSIMNILVVGHDEEGGAQLYSLDTLASCIKVPYATHGIGGRLSMSILEHNHNYNLTESEAYDIIKLCVQVIHRRLFLSQPSFQVKVVSKNGIRELPNINCYSLNPHN